MVKREPTGRVSKAHSSFLSTRIPLCFASAVNCVRLSVANESRQRGLRNNCGNRWSEIMYRYISAQLCTGGGDRYRIAAGRQCRLYDRETGADNTQTANDSIYFMQLLEFYAQSTRTASDRGNTVVDSVNVSRECARAATCSTGARAAS